jgi:hypothetical protein
VVALNVRAKARTYLRNNSNGKDNGGGGDNAGVLRQTTPVRLRMTAKNKQQQRQQKQIPCGMTKRKAVAKSCRLAAFSVFCFLFSVLWFLVPGSWFLLYCFFSR